MALVATIDGKKLKVEVREFSSRKGEEVLKIQVGPKTYDVDIAFVLGLERLSMLVDNRSYDVDIDQDGEELLVTVKGQTYRVSIEDEVRERMLGKGKARAGTGELLVKAPMPGMVVALEVKEGDAVNSGQGLLVLEAMKMQNELRSPRAGKVKTVKVKPGDKVNGGDILLVIG